MSACLLLLALVGSGCESMTKLDELPPEFAAEDRAVVTNRFGGTHHRTLVRGRLWYQTFGSELLVLDTHDGAVISRLEPLPFGSSGALVDMAIRGERLYVVSDRDAVIEFDLADQRAPLQRQVRTSRELGIQPRQLSVVDGELWISGTGGVVKWDQASEFPYLADDPTATWGRVLPSDSGPVATSGRRIHSVLDGAFLGSATMLAALPDDAGFPDGLLFVLQGTNGASVGLMTPDLREGPGFVMKGTIRGMRYADGRVWFFSDKEIGTAELFVGGELGPVQWIPVKGVRDLDGAGPNYLAVGGTFGRALYRHQKDSTGDADTFLAVTREAGKLEAAIDDGRRVLTGSDEGVWIYTIGDSIELVDRKISRDTVASDFGIADWGDARVEPDQRTVVIHLEEGDRRWTVPGDARINTLVVMGRRIWVGHERGVSLIRINGPQDTAEWAHVSRPPPPRVAPAGEVRITSGVTHLLPVRVGDQVVWVSPNGGIGVAEARRVPAPDPSS
ncbi:MAG: hypothetical protein VX403_03570 [Planctomycetota bacterium]|nr:hypothetical protein [Planctomycetota bacterium]